MNIVMTVEQSISNTANYICVDLVYRFSGNLKQHIFEGIIGKGKKKFLTKNVKFVIQWKKEQNQI